MAWVTLCEISELTEGEGKYAEVGGFHLAVFLSDGKVRVLDNSCPHAGGNMAAGHVDDGCAVCPWHGWAFRLDSGELRGSPAVALDTYPARIIKSDAGAELVQAELPLP